MGRGGDTSKLKQLTPQAQLEEAEKEKKAVAAILRGMTYDQAAKSAGYTDRSGAWKAVQRALSRSATELAANADALRALEVARLDRMLLELSTIALAATTPLDMKLRYLEGMRRNVESRAKLLNLYAPLQVEVFTNDALDAQIRQLSAQLGLPVPERVLSLDPAAAGEAAHPEGSPAPPA
jgi:hypothetical protein